MNNKEIVMQPENVAERVELLKAMDVVVRSLNDESVMDLWLTNGFPTELMIQIMNSSQKTSQPPKMRMATLLALKNVVAALRRASPQEQNTAIIAVACSVTFAPLRKSKSPSQRGQISKQKTISSVGISRASI